MQTTNSNVRRLFLYVGLTIVAFVPPADAADPNVPESYPELKRDAAGYWQVDFSQLASFDLVPRKAFVPAYRSRSKTEQFFAPEPQPIEISETDNLADRIPKMIMALDGQRVRIGGFMLPIHLDNGLVTNFLLIRSQLTCCFGVPPAPNEWVVVAMSGKGVPQQMDVPIYIYGMLHVGAMFEDHVYSGLYRLECEKVLTH